MTDHTSDCLSDQWRAALRRAPNCASNLLRSYLFLICCCPTKTLQRYLCVLWASDWIMWWAGKAPFVQTALRVRARIHLEGDLAQMSKGVHSLLLKTYREAISMRREQQTSA